MIAIASIDPFFPLSGLHGGLPVAPWSLMGCGRPWLQEFFPESPDGNDQPGNAVEPPWEVGKMSLLVDHPSAFPEKRVHGFSEKPIILLPHNWSGGAHFDRFLA